MFANTYTMTRKQSSKYKTNNKPNIPDTAQSFIASSHDFSTSPIAHVQGDPKKKVTTPVLNYQ